MKKIGFILAAAVLLFGCTLKTQRQSEAFVTFSSFREVPGVTEEEIKAIEFLQEAGVSFIYGVSPSTEAFYTVDGELKGFTILLCEWLTQIFGIPFIPRLYDWDEVLSGLESGKIDFTGELTATPERRKIYLMTDPIATRFVSYFRIAGSQPLAEIERYRPLRYGFFNGTITYNDVLEHDLQFNGRSFIPVFADNYEEAYNLLLSGDIDALLDEHVSQASYEDFGDIVIETYFPILFGPVSMSTQNPEYSAVISIVQKILESNGSRHLAEIYNLGDREYTKHKFLTHLNEEERKYLQEHSIIPFAAEHDNYPISFYNIHDKEFQGICFDVLKEIEMLTDLSFKLVNDHNDDWVVILKMLEDGEASILSELIQNPERDGRFLWPQTAVLTDYHAFLSKEEYHNIKINEIMNSRVGLVEGYAQTELFNNWFPDHAYAVTFDSFTKAFEALERDEIDLVMGSKIMLLGMTNFYERPGYKANLVLDYPYPSTFGINKDEVILCSIIDKALKFIDTEKIENQWTGRTYDYRIRLEQEKTRHNWLIAGSVFLVIFFGFFLFFRNKQFEKIQEESTSKSIFLANMSHEIRTPMNAITGMAEMLLRGDLSNEMRCYAQDIKHAGNNLISIINDILDISKIEAGKLEIIPVGYMLSSLVNDTVNIIRARLAEKLIWFETKINENIPNHLFGDEVRVRQIILNLLSNAVKYTEKGGINFSIDIDYMDDKQVCLKIIVSDTGKGIKTEDQAKLFNNFVQVDKKRNIGIEGTGLGLAITKRLCDAMGGSISLQSEYGKGSTFTVLLPQGITSPEPLGTLEIIEPNNTEAALEVKHTMQDARVLVVDDLPVNLKVVEGLLAPYKVKVDTCLSGEESLELIRQNEYDIVFMDHMMPKMDGMETTAKIREFNKQVPVIALTANAVVGMKEQFIENGFNDFLSKPIDVAKLDEILERWIKKGNRDRLRGDSLQKTESRENSPENGINERNEQFDKKMLHIRTAIANPVPQAVEPIINEEHLKTIKYTSKRFFLFSAILFIAVLLVAFFTYSISARQINRSHIEQQLAIAAETIRLRLATTVNSELSLVLKMADTPVIRQYLENPFDPQLKELANSEIAIYEQHFKNKQAFWVSDADKIFYSTGNEPYDIDPDDPESYWYNMTLYETEIYNFNINYNPHMQQINLWVNVPVFVETEDGEKKPVGLLGTGIDLTEFSDFVASGYRDIEQKITPFIFNKFDEITTALDYQLILNKVRLDDHLDKAGAEIIKAAQKLENDEQTSFIFEDNIYHISSISALEWYLAVIHPEPGIWALNDTMNMVFFYMIFLILLMFIVINIFIYRSENAITEQNKQLIEASRKAEAASLAKSKFLGKISHEIRTPINAITGMNELILRSDIPSEVRNYAQDIKQAGVSLTSIINDILNFTETDVNKLDDILIRRSINTPIPAILSIPGVDTEKGLANTGGKIDKYKQVLQVFAENVQERLPLLEQAPDKESLPVFVIHAHSIKGSAATIGAMEISAQAAALEGAGNAGDFDLIEKIRSVFTGQLSELVESINKALQPETKPETKQNEDDLNASPLLSAEDTQLFKSLASALENENAVEIDLILEELSQEPLEPRGKEILDKVSEEVLITEYGKAGAIIQELLIKDNKNEN